MYWFMLHKGLTRTGGNPKPERADKILTIHKILDKIGGTGLCFKRVLVNGVIDTASTGERVQIWCFP